MGEHTPGPWRVNENGFEVETADGQIVVAEVQFPDDGDEVLRTQGAADAHLIAAAPTLLAACGGAATLLASEFVTSSYCEICEKHAPKDDEGDLIGPITHTETCDYRVLRAAIARAKVAR